MIMRHFCELFQFCVTSMLNFMFTWHVRAKLHYTDTGYEHQRRTPATDRCSHWMCVI